MIWGMNVIHELRKVILILNIVTNWTNWMIWLWSFDGWFDDDWLNSLVKSHFANILETAEDLRRYLFCRSWNSWSRKSPAKSQKIYLFSRYQQKNVKTFFWLIWFDHFTTEFNTTVFRFSYRWFTWTQMDNMIN